MHRTDNMARWRYDGSEGQDGQIYLSGDWNLMFHTAHRKKLKHQLAQISHPARFVWHLDDVHAFDSAGALLLWSLWGQTLPAKLYCSDTQRHWFARLQDAETPTRPRVAWLTRTSERLVHDMLAAARVVGGLLLLLGQLLLDGLAIVRRPRLMPWREVSATIYRAGALSMLLLGFVGFLVGVVMTIQIAMTLESFGAAQMVVPLMGLAILRELGVVICALILAGRSGSAITAGIGAMHITEEFNALRAFGASPTQRLVLPRVLGMTLSVPLLVAWTDFTGLAGAAITSQAVLGVNWETFMTRLPEAVPIVNFWIGLIKGVIFGFIIAWVAAYFGLAAKPNTDSLSHSTTLSVVTSLSLILVVDALAGAFTTQIGL